MCIWDQNFCFSFLFLDFESDRKDSNIDQLKFRHNINTNFGLLIYIDNLYKGFLFCIFKISCILATIFDRKFVFLHLLDYINNEFVRSFSDVLSNINSWNKLFSIESYCTVNKIIIGFNPSQNKNQAYNFLLLYRKFNISNSANFQTSLIQQASWIRLKYPLVSLAYLILSAILVFYKLLKLISR